MNEILQEAQKEKEIDRKPDAAWPEQGEAEEDESFAPPSPDSRDEQELMSRLAKSDPERAGSLVKKWLRKDQN